MPWGLITEPTLGLSILKAQLNITGLRSTIFYANLWLLNWLKSDTYEAVADIWGANDFLFTGVMDSELDDKQLHALFNSVDQIRKTSKYWDKFSNDGEI